MRLTSEQIAIVNSQEKEIKIIAGAGAAKTTTLVEFTKLRPNKKFLYIAFNKSVQQEGAKKFGSNVVVKTAHGLAYSNFVRKRYKVVNELKEKDFRELFDEYSDLIDFAEFVYTIKRCFELYCHLPHNKPLLPSQIKSTNTNFVNNVNKAIGVVVNKMFTGLGLPAAWFLSQYEFRGRVALEWAMILPMALPAYVVAYAYTDALDFSGWLAQWLQTHALRVGLSAQDFQTIWPEIRSLPGAVFVLGVALSPYVALLAKTAFEDRQVNLSEAARSLGLSPAGAFYRVVLPLARPALVAGSALVIMECLADYGTVAFFSVQTLSTGLFKTWFGYGDRSAAALMGLGMLLLAVLILAWERVVRGRAGFTGRPGQARPRLPLQGKARYWVPLVCGLGGLFGFVLPVVLLLVAGLSSAEPIAANSLMRQTLQTALYGLYALAVILPMAIVLAYGQRSMQGGGSPRAYSWPHRATPCLVWWWPWGCSAGVPPLVKPD